jgi:hypothetical protein
VPGLAKCCWVGWSMLVWGRISLSRLGTSTGHDAALHANLRGLPGVAS